MRPTLLVFTLLAGWLAVPALAHEDLTGEPKLIVGGKETIYQVWISPKNLKLFVRWTSADEKPKRFHGEIECEGLWTEADRIQTGQPGAAVKITGGGGVLRWDTETAKWIDGFDAVYNPTKMMRFVFYLDGKHADPAIIRLGASERPARWPVFYWLRNPPPEKWPVVEGFPSVSPGQKNAFFIGTDDRGYWYVKVSTQGAEQEVKFSGNITTEDGRIDLVSGFEKESDERVKQGKDSQVQFEITAKGTVEGFKFRPGGGARKLEFELSINGKDATAEQVFLGKDAKNPSKGSPFTLTR
jgi:hypothetical protein